MAGCTGAAIGGGFPARTGGGLAGKRRRPYRRLMTRLLLISGSTRDDSLQTAALRTAVRFAPPEVTATLYDALGVLPAFVPGRPKPPGSAALLRQVVAASDAILFCTPQYAGSLPGSLKNLLDWLVDGGDLTGKAVAWLSVSAPSQDDGAHTMLETVLAHAGARLQRPACIRIPLPPSAIGPDGIITEPQLHMAVTDVLAALSRIVAPARPQPSWQAYSSLYPVVTPPETRPRWPWRQDR